MKILLSPAKTFAKDHIYANEVPYFEREAKHLHNALKKITPEYLQKQMKLSDDLLTEVLFYIKSFGKEKYQAIYTYKGQAFKSFDVLSLDQTSLTYMRDHLLILSGLYGILKPDDGISLYRLEMKDLTLGNLYTYWKPKMKSYFDSFCKGELIINLASEEYAKVLPLHMNIITIDFFEIKDGKLQKKSMAIKTMRGKFARYLIEHQIECLDHIKKIIIDGYHYHESYSHASTLVFIKEVNKS